ncbi:efflux RND transporter permease subunit [Haloglomus halophilum]|uniref:efflux RND transporter permease subunit n=1 Tax=Haloglomus halophilum TaxID=2962672 RepID=UPI0020CA2131|nr:MMPL family transporter [Haloglomus halophilum]
MVSVDSLLERADSLIVDRPRVVIGAFLVLTLVMAGGLGQTATQSGTDQFIEGNEAQEALDEINEEFEGTTFATDTGGTTLIQRSENVLSRSAMLRMLAVQERAQAREDLRVVGTGSAASIVAQTIDPSATTLAAQQRVIEDASAGQIDDAVRRADDTPGFRSLLGEDYNPTAASASATIGSLTHEVPSGLSSSAGQGGSSPLTSIQRDVADIADAVGSDITVFGSGIISGELSGVVGDSLAIVVPAASLLILAFLVYAYRDPVDLLLGVISLVMAIVWTFGFMGWADIPFGQILITVPVLLLAVGIDFGIHAVNRYREERVEGREAKPSMRTTTDQLLVAFFIVTGTTVLGFSANGLSDLPPIRDFGIVSAVGIVFTFLIFGVFLPAAKLYADELRESVGLPSFGQQPIGSEGSALSGALGAGVTVARRAPKLFLILTLVVSSGAAAYGTGLDTSFSNEDFLPPEEMPDYVEGLPAGLAPGEYTVTETINFLEDEFQSSEGGGTVIVYVRGNLRQEDSLEQLYRANEDPPDIIVAEDRRADAQSLLGVIDSYAARDPEFAALVERNDLNDNGVPDDNLEDVYDALTAPDSPVRDQALRFITEDYSATQVRYTVEAGNSDAAVVDAGEELAGRVREGGVATGQTVVFKAIQDTILLSSLTGLAAALVATALFLMFIYYVIEGRPSLGLANLVPILVAIALLAGSMRFFGVPLNALTATIFSIAVGVGIDYSAHIVHRFAEEFDETDDLYGSLDATVQGTGGALLGSMLTTSSGTAVLVLAITPILGQFGLVIALSVFFSFLTAVLVTPPVMVVWHEVTVA